MEALKSVARTLVDAGRWVAPLGCALAVSSTLAVVVNNSLTRAPSDVSASTSSRAAAMSGSQIIAIDMGGAAADGAEQVLLASRTEDGEPLEIACMVTRDKVSADVLEIHRQDLAEIIRALCNGSN